LQPPQVNEDVNSSLRVIVGNGLRADIWPNIIKRFGIKKVVEHYGATEMPGAAVLNWTNRVGSCGYFPPSLRKAEGTDRVVKYNVEKDKVVRGPDGFCIECADGEVGELLMKLVDGKYDGYVDLTATSKKMYKDVFEKGDCWWSSGDLLLIDKDGFYYFIDRAGDSFRWKGENVSTTEVCAIVSSCEGIKEANVYGVPVPNYDGKACMASLLVADNIDFSRLYNAFKESLPTYARPYFLRIRREENSKTSTFKFLKTVYAAQGFDPEQMSDDLYFLNKEAETYVPLTSEVFNNIVGNHYRLI